MIFFNAKRNLYVMHVVCVCAMWGVCVINGSSIAASLPVRSPYYCVRPRLERAAARSALVRGAFACA